MSTKELICIVCPNGCELSARLTEADGETKVEEVTGGLCDKGISWAEQEIVSPMRTIASSVLVENGDSRLLSVRTDTAIPKGKIFEVMDSIKKVTLKAPVNIGDVIIENPAGTDCRIIATRQVETA